MMEGISLNAPQACLKENFVKQTDVYQMEIATTISTTVATTMFSSILAVVQLYVIMSRFLLLNVLLTTGGVWQTVS